MSATLVSNAAQVVADRVKADRMEADGRHLVELYAQRVRLTKELAACESPTGAMVVAVIAKGDELDVACDAFRRRYYPRRAEVLVGLYAVMVASATRRRVEAVLDLFEEYCTSDTERRGSSS